MGRARKKRTAERAGTGVVGPDVHRDDRPSFNPRRALIAAVIVFCAGLAVYALSLRGDFVWDDMLLVLDNTYLTGQGSLEKIFTTDLFHMTDETTGYYRPLQVISYRFDHALWGTRPVGYHLTNILLHGGNVLLVFALSLFLVRRVMTAAFVAGWFAVHPAFVPIVSYVAGRADLLGAFSGLLCVLCGVAYACGPRPHFFIGAVLCYGAALLSKEYYATVPLFIVLFCLVYAPRTVKRTLPLILTLAGTFFLYAVLRATVLDFHQRMGTLAEFSFSQRVCLFPYILTQYCANVFLPVTIGLERQLVYTSMAESRFLLSFVTPLALVSLTAFFWRTGKRLPVFFLLWFVVGIIPVANLFFPLKHFFAAHWLYFPSLGAFLCVGSVVGEYAQGSRRRARVVVAVGIIYLAGLAGVTVKETAYWHDEGSLYRHLLQQNPDSSRILFNQGKVYELSGDCERAVALYDRAIEESGGDAAYMFGSRALLYRTMGRKEEARSDFERAVALAPDSARYRTNLGGIYAELGLIDRARAQWQRALELDPHDELARKNLKTVRGSGNATNGGQ